MESKYDYTDMGDEILRATVFDYTKYCNVSMPNRDQSYFNREQMIRPFDNISDKVDSIIHTLKIYWMSPANSEILRAVKQESLLGQAIYLLATKTSSFDGFEMKFEVDTKEIPVVFCDLMRVYTSAGYDVTLLKPFLEELYEEYYPKKYVAKICEESFKKYLEEDMFDFIDHLMTCFESDIILKTRKMNRPDLCELKRKVMISKDLWTSGIEVDGESIEPIRIISPTIELITGSLTDYEFIEILTSQIDGVAIRAAEKFEFSTKDRDRDEIGEDGFDYTIIELKRTDELLIRLEIAHGCTIENAGATTTKSIIRVVYSLIPNKI